MGKIRHTKKALIEALEKSLGIVTVACKKVGVARQTFYNYKDSDPEFKAAVDELENVALDFVESQLFQQIRENNSTSTIFFLKTKGKHRGYIERTELTGLDGAALTTPYDLSNATEEQLLLLRELYNNTDDSEPNGH